MRKEEQTVRVAVDIGGTFTDVALEIKALEIHNGADTHFVTAKTPTTPTDPVVGALTGVRLALADANVEPAQVASFIHGTTLATNALIERKGATVGVITTEGFRDILEIAYERRYDQYDVFLDKPDMLVPRERCFTIKERMTATGEVLMPLDEASLESILAQIDAANVQSVAICLLHAYANPAHERQLAQLLQQERPELSISLSSEVSPEIREYDRLCTTVANAYIRPLMQSYLTNLEQALAVEGFDCPIFIMTSSGGMTTLETAGRYPIRLVESGPSGGAILAAQVAQSLSLEKVISFDMGGTTAKICLIDDGQPQTTRNFEIARAERFMKGSGLPVRIPVIEMIEIGAGGGSIARLDRLRRLTVGPDSAGSEPGPAGFGRGGTEATVTDSDVVLGHIELDAFAEGRLQIDRGLSETAVSTHIGQPLNLSPQDAAFAIGQIVDENMASAGRIHAVERGRELGSRTMIAFGGNGPLHAACVAEKMGVSRIVIPQDPGVGSAIGFLFAPVSYEIVRSAYTTVDDFDFATVNQQLREMQAEALQIVEPGALGAELVETRTAFMRYKGQGHEIEVTIPNRDLETADLALLRDAYDREYRAQFQRSVPAFTIEIMNWSVTIATKTSSPTTESEPVEDAATTPTATKCQPVYLGQPHGEVDCPIYHRANLTAGDRIEGPALIVESQTTTLLTPELTAVVDSAGNLVLQKVKQASQMAYPLPVLHQNQAIDLQIMWNRLLALVEEQGQVLIRTAFSPIVRECGDISAGIFDLQGRMLAQAVTGTPGHINTMAEAVKYMIDRFPIAQMQPGDVYMTNDPWLASGHLNDFLLVQPVFKDGSVIGFTSCTSHLIDLGGRGMGPEGSDIYDEGLFIPPCKLVDGGKVNELLINVVKANSREPIQNEGDTYALIACCEVGATRLLQMMEDFGIDGLDELADYIIDTSYQGTIDTIAEIPSGVYPRTLMVDGYDFEIKVEASLMISEDKMVLDFTGTSPCSKYGINVPLNYAVAYAVFGIRCLVASDIPNNAGSLAPFIVTAPEGCILNALHPAPVAMRHTIGQLMPDVVFGCLHQAMPGQVPAEGASCMYDLPMRNVVILDKDAGITHFATELTHNGGTGARPTKDGLSATAYPSGVWGSQVEITEATTPLIVYRRELRPDSGGAGTYRGGLGQVLEIESGEERPFQLFLSVERMIYPARGLAGGQAGAAGHIAYRSGKRLPGKGEFEIPAGERLIFQTPGGGGYGDPREREKTAVLTDLRRGLISAEAAHEVYGLGESSVNSEQ
ncbi:MAG: hydantoinase B/oxoprolinase family protein [Chloroflexota bacterium]